MLKIVLFILLTLTSFASRVALIVGDAESPESQILLKVLKKQRHKVKVFSLKDGEFPYQEVFQNYIDTLAIRVVEKKDPSSHMDMEEAEFWTNFLTSHGSLTLFADTLGSQEIYESSFPNYVEFRADPEEVDAASLLGQQKDLISLGKALPVNLGGEMDVIHHRSGSMEAVYKTETGQMLAMKKQTCAFRISYFTFLPSQVTDFRKRDEMVVNAIDWNLGFALGTGMQAPDFPILKLDGSQTGFYNALYDHGDKIFVLEFMATWCSVCAKQLPVMAELSKWIKGKDVVIEFVNYKESIETVQGYLEKHPEIDWDTVITENGLGAKKFGVKGLPSLFILDATHKVRYIHKGRAKFEVLQKEINSLLREKKFNSIYKN